MEGALAQNTHSMGELHSLVENVRVMGEEHNKKLTERMAKALNDQREGVQQLQTRAEHRQAEVFQKLQSLLLEGEQKQQVEAQTLQQFLMAGEQKRQTQLEEGFSQITQVTAGLQEQRLLFQTHCRETVEGVNKKCMRWNSGLAKN